MDNIHKLAELLTGNGITISVAESCTGGALACAITSVSGSSRYFDRGFVSYSNQAKVDMLRVDAELIQSKGAVSETVAKEMAKGVAKESGSDIAVAITGIAGPTGGTIDKPVGTVCFGFSVNNRLSTSTQSFQGNRKAVINQSVDFALNRLISLF